MYSFKSTFFEPHVGGKFGTSNSLFKRKILILGDSHYCDAPCTSRQECGDREVHPTCASFTSDVIEEYLDQNSSASWKKTFTTFVNSLLRKSSSITERELVFESVAFYNFLQRSAGSDPTSAHLHENEYTSESNLRAFLEVIEQLRPDIVISWGDRVWNALPNNWGHGEANKGEGIDIDAKRFKSYYDYPFRGSRILLVGVHHPSVGYATGYHSEVFKALGVD